LPGPDDQLRSALERLAPPADPAGAYERIVEKKIRRRIYRKLQAAALTVVVLAGTAGGTVALTRAFRPDAVKHVIAPLHPRKLTGNGEIAFVSAQEAGGRIYAITPDGTKLQALTADQAHGAPAWSSDGSTLVFSSSAGNAVQDIFVMNADGSGLTNLTNTRSVIEEDPAWSPDGRQIAFISNRQVSFEVWIMNADGSEARRLTKVLGSGVRHPAWSPDGKMIAFSAPEFGSTALGGIFVMSADGSGVRQIYQEKTCCVFDVLGPNSWSPDGKYFVFTRDNHNGNIGDTGIDLFAVPADGGDLVRLTNDTVSGSPSWSPDGSRIVFARDDGLYVMDARGMHETKVPDAPAGASSPVWRPAARSLPGPPSATHTTPPSNQAPPSPPSLGSNCDASDAIGDFDNDGLPDLATVAKTACLVPDAGYPYDTPYALDVRWGGGTTGTAPLPDCQEVCRAVSAADLDVDGSDEFILQIGSGASTQFLEVYELPKSEAFAHSAAATVSPGAPGFKTGRPAVFATSGSVTHLDFLTCETAEGADRVIATSAVLNADQTRWDIHETVFEFAASPNPDGEFTVVSTADSTLAFDPTGKSEPEPRGSACWGEGAQPSPSSTVP
jgi:TolB protein